MPLCRCTGPSQSLVVYPFYLPMYSNMIILVTTLSRTLIGILRSGSAAVPPKALKESSLDSGGTPCLVAASLQSASMVILPPFLLFLSYL